MDYSSGFVVTPAVAALRDFLARPGARHAFLIGAAGAGKTATLHYLADGLRTDDHLVVIVSLREIRAGDELVVGIARAFLDQAQTRTNSLESDPLDQIRAQFADHFTASQNISRAAEVLERIIELVIVRTGQRSRAYIFLDGLDEVDRAGEIVVAVESLAECLRSANIVVASRESHVVNRLGSRTPFEVFSLTDLSQAETGLLIRRIFGDRPIPEAAFRRLVLTAGGNPLLLTLFADYFRRHGDFGAFETTTSYDRLDYLYRDLFATGRIGADARLLLNLLVLLRPVSTDYLIRISGMPIERARAALGELSRSGLISSSDRQTTFVHALVAKYYLENNLLKNDIDIEDFEFGDEAAERDRLLKCTFMPPHDLHLVISGTKTIVLGDRGAGKSAIFRALMGSNGAAATPVLCSPAQ